jgi:hypothetical protein
VNHDEHAAAVTAERERIKHAVFGCLTCGEIHQPRDAEWPSAPTWAAPDGHPYRPRYVTGPTPMAVIRAAIEGDQP